MSIYRCIGRRNSKEHVKNLLRNSVSAKFAVGYFFTSGLEPIMKEIQNLNERTQDFDWKYLQQENNRTISRSTHEFSAAKEEFYKQYSIISHS